MTVSQAVGLCPSLSLWEPDPVYYDEQFSNLLLALGDVSPVIETAELGRVYVGVDGLEKLYGSPEKQVETIRQTVAVWQEGLGTYCPTDLPAYRLGWGRGKFTAWVAATRAKPGGAVIISDEERAEFTASQPVGVLQVDQDTHRRLWQLGIKTLSDLARLPEVAIVSQFGRMGHRLWLMATGRVVDPVAGRETPEPIVFEIDFPNPVADRTMLAHALDRLIERALHHPQRTDWRILEVQARAQQENGASWMIGATLKNPSANGDHISAPLKVRLEQTPPARAVETLAVEFTQFARGTHELQLFARDATSSARAGRQSALRTAVREIRTRYRYSGLYQVVEVQPRSRLLERRYALINYDP
jgi:nucleotidyltransferase/DNA polymerase involved in DNA repair